MSIDTEPLMSDPSFPLVPLDPSFRFDLNPGAFCARPLGEPINEYRRVTVFLGTS